MPVESPSPPPRPSAAQERWASRLFLALSPRLPRVEPPDPPRRLEPWTTVWIDRPGRRGPLQGTWYPAAEPIRGAVLLLPPWLEWGRAYFHRRRRVETLRQTGYHALAPDFPGFAGSAPVDGFFDRDVSDALADLERRAPDLPLHLWGVSAGGYWSHPALSDHPPERLGSAFFEDVSHHLLEWASRVSPAARPFHRLFRLLFPDAFRYLDARLHAPALGRLRTAYVSGADDRGVRPEDTRELARRAGAPAHVVPGAGHLEAIKRETSRVLDMALETFGGAAAAQSEATRRRSA